MADDLLEQLTTICQPTGYKGPACFVVDSGFEVDADPEIHDPGFVVALAIWLCGEGK
jgi:hypothetical protein